MTSQLVPFVGTAIAFFYGLFRFSKKGVAMYFQLLTYAMGCFMLGKLFCVLCLLTINELPYPFNIGYFGYMGCFAFLFSANYGQIDSIVDDGGDEIKKARQLGFLAPIAMLICVGLAMFSGLSLNDKIIMFIIYIPAFLGSYYNLKHFIAPDFDFLFLKAIRPCNIPVLLIYFFGIGRVYFEMKMQLELATICSVFMSIACIALILLAERGQKQWKI